MSAASPFSLVQEQTLTDGTKAYTTLPSLVAPIANLHLVYALESSLPTIPGEMEVLLEWLQRGTQTRSRRELGDAFGALGIEPAVMAMGGGVVFSMQCLDACRERALALTAEMLYHPRFDEEELKHVLQEFDEDDRSSMDDPMEMASRAQRLARWSGTTLSAPANGTQRTRKQLTPAYLRELHASILTRPAIIAIASEDGAAWLSAAEALLSNDRPERRWAYRPPIRSDLQATPRDIVVNAPSLEHVVVMQFSPGPSTENLAELAAARLHHEALTDGMSAPLMSELRGQLALSYSVSSSLVDRADMWDQLYEVEPEPKRVQESLDAARTLWNKPDLLHEEDVQRARAQLATSERLQSIDAGRALSAALRDEILRGRPLTWRASFAEALLSVSFEEVLAAGQSYGLSQAPICTVIVGPTKKMPAAYRTNAITLKSLFQGF